MDRQTRFNDSLLSRLLRAIVRMNTDLPDDDALIEGARELLSRVPVSSEPVSVPEEDRTRPTIGEIDVLDHLLQSGVDLYLATDTGGHDGEYCFEIHVRDRVQRSSIVLVHRNNPNDRNFVLYALQDRIRAYKTLHAESPKYPEPIPEVRAFRPRSINPCTDCGVIGPITSRKSRVLRGVCLSCFLFHAGRTRPNTDDLDGLTLFREQTRNRYHYPEDEDDDDDDEP